MQRTLRTALLPPLLAIGLLMYLLVHQVLDMRAASDEVARTDRTLAQAEATLRLLIDMETGQRGFLIGGDERFLQPYNQGRQQIGAALSSLNQLASSVDARRQIVTLTSQQARWQETAANQIALRRVSGPQAVAAFNQGLSKAQMDEIRAGFDRFIKEQQGLREARSQKVQRETRLLLTFGTGAALVVGALLAVVSVHQLRTLSRHYHGLVEGEQQAREYMTTTLQSIGDAVLVSDKSGRVTLMNPVAETLTGWRLEDAQGKPHETIFDICHEETGEPVPSPVESVLRTGQIVTLANHTALRRRNGQQLPIEDSAAPILDGVGNLEGVVLVFRDISERKAKEAELARLVEKDRRIAETLQQSMLLTPPENAFPGLVLSERYEAARDEALVGGDFHDAYALAGGKVALVVGDVTGKGLDAATYTAEIKFVVRAYLREDPEPARALERLNQFLIEAERLGDRVTASGDTSGDADADAGGSKMVAIAVAVMELATGDVACACAGAESPLVLWADGRSEELPITGSVAGMIPGAAYDTYRLRLAPSDVLLFTTDGITEARSRKRGFFGPEGIIRSAREVLSPPTLPLTKPLLDQTARHIAESARTFAGGKLRDDLCLLLVSRR